MRRVTFLSYLLFLLTLFLPGDASSANLSLTADQQTRADSLYKVFIAPCCWRQSVAVHNSPQAAQVRAEIDAMVTAGESNAEIKAALIHEYGHGILMETEGLRKVAVYAVPCVAISAGLLLAAFWIRRHQPAG